MREPASAPPAQRRSALLAVLLSGVLGLAGCATTVAGTPSADPAPAPTEGPGSDPVAWVDSVCGGVLEFATPVAVFPDYAADADPAAVKRTFSGYLGGVVSGVTRSRDALDRVGRSPAAGGDEALDRMRGALEVLEQDFTQARAAIEAADPNDTGAFLGALGEAESTLRDIAVPDPIAELGTIPRLQRATERAEQCDRLSALAAATPR